MFAHIRESVVSRFLDRAARGLGIAAAEVNVWENSTEELLDASERGNQVKLYATRPGVRPAARPFMVKRPGAKPPGKRQARMEETYLYSTRRWPGGINDNTLGTGNLTVNTYPFFTSPMGSRGDQLGFPTALQLSLNETNMELPGQVPAGQRFVFSQLGITFSAGAAKADIDQLLEAANLQFSMAGGTFNLMQGPIKFWPSGMGNSSGDSSANGFPDIRAVRNLRIARNIGPGDVFQYSFQIPRSTKSTDGSNWALSAFVNSTIWLYGGWKTAVMG
jgi:hypothetical protein